jgi:glycosyltransferase involved in cell wall biosynthesis
MRVLHVTEALGGGIQSAIANYVDGLHDVEHAVFARARDGQATYGWPASVAHEAYRGSLPGFFVRLVQKVREERPDVVHLHSSFAGVARAVLPHRGGLVYSPHCYAMERRDIPGAVRWSFAAVEFLLAQRPQATVAVSPREAHISGRLNAHNPARVVLNPSPLQPQGGPGFPSTAREVVMVGRIQPQKDPRLFAAVARLHADSPWRFVWIGDGEGADRADLEAAGVEVTGWLPPAALRERLTGAALYLHTAAWEGGPVSAVEAAALGVPVIARGIPSMRSLGYPPVGESPRELAFAVRRFFLEPALADSVARASAAIASQASKPAMAAELREAYTSAMARTSRGRPSAR